jgi:hypothetical protein
MALKSIAEEWKGYWKMVAPIRPAVNQAAETKQAFFAGAWALFTALEEIGEPHISETQGEQFLEARRAEMLAFKKQIMAKYCERN